MFSYFSYAAAFVNREGQGPTLEAPLVAIALAIAPLVFIVVGFVSRNAQAPRRILWAMLLLLLLGLSLGLISPVLGAAAGFGVGTAICLRLPDIPDQMRRRLIAVALAVVYTMLLLFAAPSAGVTTGAVVPILVVGFADEFGAWRRARLHG